MADTKTVSRWKIGLWIGMTALLLAWIVYSLAEGEVVVGSRRQTTHYLRSNDPTAFWLGIAFYAVMLGILVFFLLRAKLHPRTPPQPPDLTPRDWMGNPRGRK